MASTASAGTIWFWTEGAAPAPKSLIYDSLRWFLVQCLTLLIGG